MISSTKIPSFESIAIPQISTAAISLVASTTMAVTIARTGNRLSVPYRRIIFGLSISDILQSVGALTGPISVPRDIPNCWGLGDAMSCRVSAFFLTAGFMAVPMYTSFICWYYLCKLKYRMTDSNFARNTETRIHAFILVFVTIFTLVALMMDTFHVEPFKASCGFATVPLGCRLYHDFVGECDAVITARVNAFIIIVQSLRAACVLGMAAMMGMVFWHAINQIRIFQPRPMEGHRSTENLPSIENAPNPSQSSEHVLYLSSLYRNEIVMQTICYIGAFLLTYMPEIVLYCIVTAGGRPSSSLTIAVRYTLPLGGLFNILAYSRPQVACLRRNHPEHSWLLCLLLVLSAGGELPPQRNNSEDDDHGPRFSFSNVSPFGVISESESLDSVEVFDGRSLSLRESDLNFNPEENWSYVQGGSSLRVDRIRNILPIQKIEDGLPTPASSLFLCKPLCCSGI